MPTRLRGCCGSARCASERFGALWRLGQGATLAGDAPALIVLPSFKKLRRPSSHALPAALEGSAVGLSASEREDRRHRPPPVGRPHELLEAPDAWPRAAGDNTS